MGLEAATWAVSGLCPCEDAAVKVFLGQCFLFAKDHGRCRCLPHWFVPCGPACLVSPGVLGKGWDGMGWGRGGKVLAKCGA